MEHFVMKTPLGFLRLVGDADGLRSACFVEEAPKASLKLPEVLKPAVSQLEAYFNNNRNDFELRLKPVGTDFQKKVWDRLLNIPFGKTKSYRDIANELGDPKVIRAAASANGKNPIAIIIPCHRVVGTDGSLTGYAGGLDRKKWLLDHESPVKQGELF